MRRIDRVIDEWIRSPATPSGHVIGFAIGNGIAIACCLGFAAWSLWFS